MKTPSFSLPRLPLADWFLGVPILLAGIALRLLSLGCYEFKDDQARTALNALCALRDGLLIAHGQPGSTGIPNPPGAPILLAGAAIFGTGSLTFAVTFTLLSILTVGLVWLLLRRVTSERTAWYAAILFAACPAFIWNASNLWGPNLLPLHAVVMLWCLCRWEDGGSPWYWFAAGMTAGVAAWAWHLSAIFLLPALLVTARRRMPPLRCWVGLAAAGLALFAPWFWYLAFIWEPEIVPMPSSWQDKLAAWVVEPGRMDNLFFFAGYLPLGDCLERLGAAIGAPAWAALLLAALSCLPFWCGLVRALAKNDGDRLVRPVLAMVIPAAIGYLLLRLRLHQHYLMVIAPALMIAAAAGLTRLPPRMARALLLAGCLPALAVTLAMQLSFRRAGGDWYEFGPSGNFLEAVATELDAVAPGTPLDVEVAAGSETAGRKLDFIATSYVFWRHQTPGGLPLRLVIDWRDDRFVWELQPR